MPVIHSFTYEPLFKTSKGERMIDPAQLSPDRKQILWLGIKQLEPALAELLKQDDGIELLKQQMSASVRFSQSDYNRFTKAGRLVIEERR